jgi:hypothetical protein
MNDIDHDSFDEASGNGFGDDWSEDQGCESPRSPRRGLYGNAESKTIYGSKLRHSGSLRLGKVRVTVIVGYPESELDECLNALRFASMRNAENGLRGSQVAYRCQDLGRSGNWIARRLKTLAKQGRIESTGNGRYMPL